MTESGHISIHAENILPIIKRWLYSEKEIYIRELVSNGADALTKLQKLALVGEVEREIPEARITFEIDKDQGTLTITDTGIGMTAEEIKRYINQVAFSGLQDFLEKYKDKDDSQQVIGHFGLGFYSSFMVASKVEIDTLSYREGAKAARWSCDGSTEFQIAPSDRQQVGTSIILHIDNDSKEMLDEATIGALLNRYCAFIRYPIHLGEKVVNDPQPIWTRAPSELKDEDYVGFFQKLFPMSPEPLFWIHLNLDYPFNLKGVLYFPKLKHELDASQGEVKLYCNQVYVADNTKELIPEFLTLLKGVIDCPDLPLNVSRSYLQNDPTVRKISEHITKKVADKIAGLAKTDQEQYEKFWDDIQPFVKFGMMRDHKFFERVKDHLIFKSSAGGYTTLEAYRERMKDKIDDGTVIYCSDEHAQAGYLRLFREQELEAIITDKMIDLHFLPFFEMQSGRKFTFQRIDADVSKHLMDEAGGSKIVDPTDNKTHSEKLEEVFKKNLEQEGVTIRIESLKSPSIPGMLLVDENRRRMQEMAQFSPLGAVQSQLKDEGTLVINQNNPAVKNVLKLARSFNRDREVKLAVNQIYDLARLQQGQGSVTGDVMQAFIDRSSEILERLGQADPLVKTDVAPQEAITE